MNDRFYLKLNNEVIKTGSFKTLMSLFNGLSGVEFARSSRATWLSKMSSPSSYVQYLKILGLELNVKAWNGELSLWKDTGVVPAKIFLFKTHEKIFGEAAEATVSEQNKVN